MDPASYWEKVYQTKQPEPAARTHRDRTLAAGIQRRATEEGAGRTDTLRLRQTVKVILGSKPFRYSKRGDVAYTLFAVALISCASAAETGLRYRRISTGDGELCIDSRLSTKEMKMEGILGSDLGSSVRGVFVTYPMKTEQIELTIFVRTAGKGERPLPAVSDDELQPAQHIKGLSVALSDSQKGTRFVATDKSSAAVGRFVAVCRDLPIPRQCSRPFRYAGLVGTYSFTREELPDWRNLENALNRAISSKDIANCDKAK